MSNPDIVRKNYFLKTITEHLKAQNGPARNGSECVYRSTEGKKCAVGAIIPDAEYHPGIEGATLLDLLCQERVYTSCVRASKAADLEKVLTKSGVNPEDYDFLYHLQSLHDDGPGSEQDWTWSDIRKEFVDVAAKFGLDTSLIPE
jgi:hypothetical protein